MNGLAVLILIKLNHHSLAHSPNEMSNVRKCPGVKMCSGSRDPRAKQIPFDATTAL